jgi:hypothetical protein
VGGEIRGVWNGSGTTEAPQRLTSEDEDLGVVACGSRRPFPPRYPPGVAWLLDRAVRRTASRGEKLQSNPRILVLADQQHYVFTNTQE